MTVALDAALSGLRVAQQALNVASTNIANASTEGYTRKILPQEVLMIAGQGFGAVGAPLIRHVDTALLRDRNTQIGVAEGYTIAQKYLSRIQDFHGASNSGKSLSSQVTALADSFTLLSAAPDDETLLTRTLLMASQTADKINDFSQFLTDLRQGTEADLASAVVEVNAALDSIARLNGQITKFASAGESYADLEDHRDAAIKTVAKYLDISTFDNGQSIIVITKQGQTLADNAAYHLFFQKSTTIPTAYYPGGGLNGLTVESPSGIDIAQGNLGGQLGALFDLRDRTLPEYMAQLDEFSQKLADRFQNEGLKLFTDLSGNVPANVADPGLVGYVGFSAVIQVNSDVAADTSLIRHGTTGGTELSGSNEVIRRVAQFAFGSYRYQQAVGGVDISAGALIPLLGLTTQNTVVGTTNIAAYAPDLGAVPGLSLPASFTLTIGGVPQIINIAPGDTAADLVNTINTAFGGPVSVINSEGHLSLYSNSAIALADITIGAGGMAALGFAFGVTNPPNPSFQVQVGTRTPVAISIAPGDTSVNLLAALNAVPGLTAVLNGGGQLVLTPTDGGDLKVTDILGAPMATMGLTVTNVPHFAFRQNNLGPGGDLSTGLLANSTLQDYISSVITDHGEDANNNQVQQEREESYMNILERRAADASGVNIDQEMSDLIRIQSAYAAAARIISASQTMFDALLNSL